MVSPYVDISADVIVSVVVERFLDGIALSELLLKGGSFVNLCLELEQARIRVCNLPF